MQVRQKQVIEAFQRVQDFVRANPVSPPLDYGMPKQRLEEVVALLTGFSTTKVEIGRLGRQEKGREDALRKALREQHLRPIALIARATLATSPGIDRALRMPRPQLPTLELVDEARGIRNVAARYEADFIASGRPATFLADLDAAIEALLASLFGKAQFLGVRAGATKAVAKTLRRGRDAVKLLDAIVTTAFAGNADLLTRWRIASRIRGLSVGTPAVPATGGTADENLPAKAA